VRRLPWPIRSVIAGTAGTATLSLAYELDHRIRPELRGPVDYDDSLVPGEIVANILDLRGVSGREEEELGLALRWSYGSAFGLWHGILRLRLKEPAATILFGSTLISATVTMFPLLGHTPPPWRWPRGFLATAVMTHVAYTCAVALVDDRLRSRR
jgi:hypothetical protein